MITIRHKLKLLTIRQKKNFLNSVVGQIVVGFNRSYSGLQPQRSVRHFFPFRNLFHELLVAIERAIQLLLLTRYYVADLGYGLFQVRERLVASGQRGVVSAADKDQAALLADAITRLCRLNAWLGSTLEVQRDSALASATDG